MKKYTVDRFTFANAQWRTLHLSMVDDASTGSLCDERMTVEYLEVLEHKLIMWLRETQRTKAALIECNEKAP